MPDAAGDRARVAGPSNGSASPELAQLRELLIGSELDELAAVKARLEDPAQRSADIARVLPDAVRAARGKNLRDALEPLFEKAFQNSVRQHRQEMADAIYPVIGPSIRKSIAAAIREFAEGLNQIIEKSASWRAIRWRIEARTTGKPFAEILLARSLLYSVEQVFLIHRSSGLLLQHVASEASVLKDADMIAGMLTAVTDFYSDSFTEGGQDLETIDTGQFRLWIVYGPKTILVAAVSGSAPVQLRDRFRSALDQIHETLYAELDTFKQGDVSVFDPARPYLQACLLGQSGRQERRPVLRWVLAAALTLLLAALVSYDIRQRDRWNRYFAALRRQPGIAVTQIERRGSGYLVVGLKDPAAPDPVRLLAENGLDAGAVSYAWQPYLSLNTPFALQRDVAAARNQIEKQMIRFEIGTPKLPLGEASHLDELAASMLQLLRASPASRITVMGHTDETGTEGVNMKLSLERANTIVEALAAQGVPSDRLKASGMADKLPMRTGDSEWDRAANRSVSFSVK